jgi:hypothetical protein
MAERKFSPHDPALGGSDTNDDAPFGKAPQPTTMKDSEYIEKETARIAGKKISDKRDSEIQKNMDTRSEGAKATTRNKALQAKLQRKPQSEPEPAVKDLPEQASLLSQGLKRQQTVSDAVKTKQINADRDKRNGIVSSRKQISSAIPNRSISKTPPSKSEKAIPYKR